MESTSSQIKAWLLGLPGAHYVHKYWSYFVIGAVTSVGLFKLFQSNWMRSLLGLPPIKRYYESALENNEDIDSEDIDAQVEAHSISTDNTKVEKKKQMRANREVLLAAQLMGQCKARVFFDKNDEMYFEHEVDDYLAKIEGKMHNQQEQRIRFTNPMIVQQFPSKLVVNMPVKPIIKQADSDFGFKSFESEEEKKGKPTE